jgi:hypothetical protein
VVSLKERDYFKHVHKWEYNTQMDFEMHARVQREIYILLGVRSSREFYEPFASVQFCRLTDLRRTY